MARQFVGNRLTPDGLQNSTKKFKMKREKNNTPMIQSEISFSLTYTTACQSALFRSESTITTQIGTSPPWICPKIAILALKPLLKQGSNGISSVCWLQVFFYLILSLSLGPKSDPSLESEPVVKRSTSRIQQHSDLMLSKRKT